MSDNRQNPTVLLSPPSGAEQRTFVVFGVMRGGTSMVSGMLRGFGVNMGESLADNHEDSVFETQNRYLDVAPVDVRNQRLRDAISERNERNDVWGWKYPKAGAYLAEIFESIRNPHLICVFRDLSAIVSAHQRWHNDDPIIALNTVLADHLENVALLSRLDCPKMMVSYEKAVRHPDNFAQELSHFVGLDIPEKFDYRAFMAPEEYKSVNEHVASDVEEPQGDRDQQLDSVPETHELLDESDDEPSDS